MLASKLLDIICSVRVYLLQLASSQATYLWNVDTVCDVWRFVTLRSCGLYFQEVQDGRQSGR